MSNKLNKYLLEYDKDLINNFANPLLTDDELFNIFDKYCY